MPRVPTYDEFTVAQGEVPGVRQSSVASTDLLDTSQSSVEFGKALQFVGDKMQQREDLDKVFQADSNLTMGYTDWQKTNANRAGANAKGITKDAADFFDKQIEQLSGALANDNQRIAFKAQAMRKKMAVLDHYSFYEADQMKRSLLESANASIAGDINTAAGQVGSPTEDSAIAAGLGGVVQSTKALSEAMGWTPEIYAVELRKRTSAFWRQVFENMVETNPEKASKVFNEAFARGEIDGAQKDDFNGLINSGASKVKAQRISDEAVKLPTQQAALDYVRTNAGYGDTRDMAEQYVMKHFADNRMAAENLQKDAADKAWGIYSKTGSYSKIPAAILNAMDGKDRETLKTHAKAQAEGKAVKTDPTTFLEVQSRIYAGEKIDLRQYVNKIDVTRLGELNTLQQKPQKELKDAATLDEQITAYIEQLKLKDEAKGQFKMAAQDAVQAAARQKGKELTQEERTKLLDGLVVEGHAVGSGRLYETSGKAYEFHKKPEASTFVPDDVRKQIVARFKEKKGRKPTDAEIVKTYTIMKGAQR